MPLNKVFYLAILLSSINAGQCAKVLFTKKLLSRKLSRSVRQQMQKEAIDSLKDAEYSFVSPLIPPSVDNDYIFVAPEVGPEVTDQNHYYKF